MFAKRFGPLYNYLLLEIFEFKTIVCRLNKVQTLKCRDHHEREYAS
ncbi:hypothetical protein I656_00318 [Geobacillus sp. WSUCF1]|nr:hypothetical protein I656_00318 [Geobacillus sp. WSUCF1]